MYTSLGNWEIGSPIGGGAMGTVHRCRNQLIDIDAAIKLVPFSRRTSLSRFRLEVESLFRLGTHPQVVQLLDFGVSPDENTGWIVMEYVKGEPLPAQMTESEVLQMLVQIGGALTQAHEDGIFHRDIKPKNVLRTKDRGFVLIDFGIARKQDSTKLTAVGMFVGTLAYAPPEQVLPSGARRDNSGAAWDIYALGQLAHERLTGKPVPEDRKERRNLAAVLDFKREVEALDPSGLCSPRLAALIRDATDPNPDRRLSSMSELTARATALAVLDGRESSMQRPDPPSPFRTPEPSPRRATPPPKPRTIPPELWKTALKGSLIGFFVTFLVLTLLFMQLIFGLAYQAHLERSAVRAPPPPPLLAGRPD